MKKKITVEIDLRDLDWTAIAKFTALSIKSLLENLEEDLEKRKDDTGMAIFEADKEADIALLEKHIEAFKLVLKYYGENADA